MERREGDFLFTSCTIAQSVLRKFKYKKLASAAFEETSEKRCSG